MDVDTATPELYGQLQGKVDMDGLVGEGGEGEGPKVDKERKIRSKSQVT